MSDDFKREAFEREERYIVIKRSDAIKWFSPATIDELEGYVEILSHNRRNEGKQPLECIVVESDWPEYDPVWGMIEARMTGQASKPEQAQTAVGLPGNYAADIVASSILTYLGFAQEVSMEPGADHRRDKLAEGIESYATAKTAEAVQNALEEAAMLFNQKHQEYFGSDIQDAIRSMTTYAPKKDQ